MLKSQTKKTGEPFIKKETGMKLKEKDLLV